MTLAMTLVTPHGVWASTDHRLTAHPSGALITDSSVKHVVLRCLDGSALVSYTGLGRVGKLDVSEWMREVLRGESRTVDQSMTDLREQATARFGMRAQALGVQHVFLAGAFLGGRPWAVETHNVLRPTAISTGGLQPRFETTVAAVDRSMLLAGGAGLAAVMPEDRELLKRISSRKPRRPKDFMQVLGDVNRRAAESGHRAAGTISRSCTVVFMPPSDDGVKHEWYGPDEERGLGPTGLSFVLYSIDLGETPRVMLQGAEAFFGGSITQEEWDEERNEAMKRAVQPRGRRPPPQS